MTRVLQIRRGSSAQNDNFTGLAGEITFDTTNKTMRVHDGETLGGFTLAKMSDVENVAFDINNVPSSFWIELFNTYQKTSIQKYETSPQTISPDAVFIDTETIFNTIPSVCYAVLVCINPDCGYGTNEEVTAFGIGVFDTPKINTFIKNDLMNIRLFTAGQPFWVCHKDTGAKTNIDPQNWKLKFTVCY